MSRHLHAHTLPYHHAQNRNDAPRLKESSIVARLAFLAFALACCGGFFVVLVSVAQFWLPDASFSTGPALHPLHGTANTFVSVHPNPRQRRKPPIQRSVVQRLSMLRRQSGSRGIDLEWTRQLFPHWFEIDSVENPRLDPQETLSDLILAVSYLCQGESEIDD